jgi:hypothetical protein
MNLTHHELDRDRAEGKRSEPAPAQRLSREDSAMSTQRSKRRTTTRSCNTKKKALPCEISGESKRKTRGGALARSNTLVEPREQI